MAEADGMAIPIAPDERWFERATTAMPHGSTADGASARPHLFGPVLYRRFELTEPHGAGYRDFIAISDNLHAILTDFRYHENTAGLVDGMDLLKFHFKLSGDNIVRFDGRSEFHLRTSSAAVATHPSGMTKEDIYGQKAAERSLTLCCRPQLITQTLQLDPDCLPREISRFLRDGAIDFFCRDMPLTSRMMQTISELMNPPYGPAVRHIHAHARMLDLICMLMDALIGQDKANPPFILRSRDVDTLHEARAILDDSLTGPPTVPELAKRVGLNRTKLMQGFKHLFGETVFDYSQRVRLNHARRLLTDTELPISDIAAAVGYEHQSSFTVAFKACFGHSPREARQRPGRETPTRA